MKPLSRTGLYTVFVVVSLFIFGALYSIYRLSQSPALIPTGTLSQGLWAVSQTETEAVDLLHRLSQFNAGEPDIDADDIALQLDILWSRRNLLIEGEVYQLVAEVSGYAAILENLHRALEVADPLLEQVQAGDREAAKEMYAQFAPLQPLLHQLSVGVAHRHSVAAATAVVQIRKALFSAMGLLLVAAVGSGVVTSLLMRQIRITTREVAERRAAEGTAEERAAKQRISEQRLELALQGGELGTWDWNVVTGEAIFNQRWAEMLGYTLAEVELYEGDFWAALLHPDDKAQTLYMLEQHVAGETQQYEAEYRLKTKSGNWCWVLARGRAVERGNDGRALRVTGTHLDISARKQAELTQYQLQAELEQRIQERTTELQYNRQRFEDFATASADWLWEMDAELRFTYMSPNVEQIVGVPPTWHYGKTRQEILGDGYDPAIWENHLRTLQAHEPFRDFIYPRVGDGIETRWLRASGIPLFAADGTFKGYRGSGSDVTPIVQAEQALRASRDQLRLITDNLPVLVVYLDRAWRYRFINKTAERWYACPASETLGRSIKEVLGTAGYRALKPKIEAAADGKPIHFESSFKYPDGITRSIMASCVPELDENGELQGYIALAMDITARRRAEEALHQERAQLAQRVRERTAELHATNEKLIASMQSKDEFLASMSHELRTPLNAILGLSELLRQQISGPVNPDQQRHLDLIHSSGHHLLDLINDVLDIAQVGAGSLALTFNEVAINTVCQAALHLVEPMANKKQLQLTMHLDPVVTTLWADERRLKQILVNLLSNAIKFTPAGGRVGLDVTGDAEIIQWAVWDSGIGIAEEAMAQLFEPFVQLDSGMAREYEGAGLGLSLVHQMVELHGGSVSVESTVGAGSRFTVSLPRTHAEPALDHPTADAVATEVLPAASTTTPANAPHALILLVEDHDINVFTMTEFLRDANYRVVTARDGSEAIQCAQTHVPDLILMDIQMPGMDGLEAIRRLRCQPRFADLPIIAVTALAMPSDRARCLAAGANEYLSKPVSLKRLAQVIEQQLNSKKTLSHNG